MREEIELIDLSASYNNNLWQCNVVVKVTLYDKTVTFSVSTSNTKKKLAKADLFAAIIDYIKATGY